MTGDQFNAMDKYAIAERAVLLLDESFGGPQNNGRESVRTILLDPDQQKYSNECDLYLFETVIPAIYKYGISKDFIGIHKTVRIMRNTKVRSGVCVSSCPPPSRYTPWNSPNIKSAP